MHQQTEEWLNFRKDKIGSSDAAKIYGVSPYGSAYDLWLEKTNRVKPTFNANMQYGIENEEKVRHYYMEKTGLCFTPVVMQEGPEKWMIASLDGMTFDEKDIIEIKCCNAKVFELAKQGKAVDHYYCQMQHQLMCSPKAERVHYVCYYKGEYADVIIERDDAYIQNLADKERAFYELFESDTPPEQNIDDLLLIEDEEFGKLVKAYKQAVKLAEQKNEQYKEAKKTVDATKQNLLDATDGGPCQGFGVTIKYQERTTYDYKKMQEDGINLEKYIKGTTIFPKITIKT